MKKLLQESRESLVRRASLLRLSAVSLAENMRSGSFRSLYRGHGIEFNGVREYLPGDDVRSIDWNVTARNDKPYIKTFEEEKELPVFLIIDQSFSMGTSSQKKNRLQQACEAGALLVLASEQNSSPVGMVLFDGQISFSCEPRGGQLQTMLLLSRLDEIPQNAVSGTALPQALRGASKLLRKRSLVFVFSDFRCTEWEQPLALLASQNDVVAVRITDPMDSSLPDVGTVNFSDSESGIHAFLPTSSENLKNEWRDDNNFKREMWKNYCLTHACRPLVMSTEDEPLTVLLRFFSRKERRKQ